MSARRAPRNPGCRSWLLAALLLPATLPSEARADGPLLQLHMTAPVTSCLLLTGVVDGTDDPCNVAALAGTDALQCALLYDAKLMPRLMDLMLGEHIVRWDKSARVLKKHLDAQPDLRRTRAKLDWYYPQYDVLQTSQEAFVEAIVGIGEALGERCMCMRDDMQARPGLKQAEARMMRAVQASPHLCMLPVHPGSEAQAQSMAVSSRVDLVRDAAEQKPEELFSSKADKCIFLLGVGRTGTSSLVKYLNVHMSECLIYGENRGFWKRLREFVSEHIVGVLGGHDPALNFARRIFNAFYRRTGHACIGFKEVRYGFQTYQVFKSELAFLRNMCGRSFFVLHYSEDIDRTALSQQRNWGWDLHLTAKGIRTQIDNFKRFHKEHPGESFVSTKETTFLEPAPLMKFLEHADAPDVVFKDVNN